MNKIKVLYIIDKMNRAGAQMHLARVLKSINKEQIECQIYCLIRGGVLADELSRQGIKVHVLGISRIYGIKAILKIFQLAFFIRRGKFDIVHNYLFSANIYGTIAASLAGAPFIITSRRGTGKLREGKFQHILAYRFTNPLVTKVICVTDSTKEIVLKKEKLSVYKAITIHNGIDSMSRNMSGDERQVLRKLFGINKNDKVVGLIANFNWIKGHKVFIEAVKEILGFRDDVKFLLIGEGALEEEMRSLVHKYHLADHVKFLGQRNDIAELLQIMDVSVNCSFSEGMSNTLLESMALEVPVVATDVDGNRETIQAYPYTECTGLLTEAGDAKQLASAILNTFDDENLRRTMIKNAKNRISTAFNSQRMVNEMANVYKDLALTKHVGFLLSQFPETHETFILREFIGLKEKGMDFAIYSLKKCRDKVIHKEANSLLSQTFYAPFVSLYSFVSLLFRSPLRLIKAYCLGVIKNINNPAHFFKSHIVFARSLYFAKLMKQHGIKHIHAHWATMPTTSAQIISLLIDVPYSFTAHAWDIYLNDKEILEEKIRNSQFVVTCTRANKDYIQTIAKNGLADKVSVNYHGVNCDSFLVRDNLMQKRNMIFAIGRLVEQKGFEYLIKACGVLKRKGIDFQCVIAGDGPMRDYLLNIRNNLGLRNLVELIGTVPQEQIKELFNKTSVFVMPSIIAANGDRDGIPNVILEALAMGVPVIATNVSGIPEVIVNHQTGITVKAKDEKALAKAIEEIFESRDSLNQLSINGRRKIEEDFDMYKNVNQLSSIFQRHGLMDVHNEN